MSKLTAVALVVLSFSLGCGTSHTTVCNAPATTSSCTCGACPAEFQADVYAAANGQIAAFPIQPSTGALGSPTTSAGPAASPGMAVIDGAFLYASNPQAEGGGAIDAWTITPGTGVLVTVAGSPFSLGAASTPAGLAAADNLSAGPFLYVADGGKIDALQVVDNGTGTLTAVPGSPFTSGTNRYLTVDYPNHFVFAADEDPPGGVLAFSINASNGALTAVPGSPFPISSNSIGDLQLGQIIDDPTGSFVYVAIPSTNQVAAFSIAPGSGVLTPVPGSPFSAGSGAFAITTFNNSPGSDFLYVSNNNAGTVSAYSINSTTGALTALAGSPFPINAGTLATDLSGGHLYASGAAGMMVFSINPSTGALTQIGSPITFSAATALAYASP
jgi:6-phosphogluconolactonase